MTIILALYLDAAWFQANYLPAAAKLEKAYSECSAEVSELNTNDKSPDFNTATYSFAFDGARRKFDRAIEDHKDGAVSGFRRAIVASPEITFKVFTRLGQGPLLESVDRSSSGYAQATTRIEEVASETIYSAFAFLEERVSSWMKHKDFQIKSVNRAGDKVRLNFHCRKDDRDYEGWIDFLPDRQWVIDNWDVTTKTTEGSWRYAATVSYGGDDPVPAITGMTDIGYHSNQTNTTKMIVDKLTFAKVPASEFKLSRYGYDDRIGVSNHWLWPCLVAAILAALCLPPIYRKWARN